MTRQDAIYRPPTSLRYFSCPPCSVSAKYLLWYPLPGQLVRIPRRLPHQPLVARQCLATSERSHFSCLSRKCLLHPSHLPTQKFTNPIPNQNTRNNSPHYIAFFSDSDPCTDAVLFPNGFALFGFHECDERITILGHENITFTGCPPTDSLFTQSLPTGVADDGVPALTCEPAPGPPYESFSFCPYIPGNDQVNVGSVAVIEYCS